MNFLLRGPSGWGKTHLSLLICNYLSPGSFDYCLGNELVFHDEVRVHFIDEVHLLEHPEVLYPKMDSGRYVIVVATNDVAVLPEALVNRCTEFVFQKYRPEELREITQDALKKKLPDELLDYLIESCGYNPRIILGLSNRLNIILSRRTDALKSLSLEEFKEFLLVNFGIKDGLDTMSSRYIEALASVGGTASLQTIALLTHIDQNTLKMYVEPILLYKQLLTISSKGRKLSDGKTKIQPN